MKRRLIACILLTMVALAGCAQKDQFAEWEEDWAASESAVSQDVSEAESEEVIPEELMDSAQLVKYNAAEQGLIRPYELKPTTNDAPNADWAYSAFKVIEANIIKQGKANKDTIDLSEGNFIYYAVNNETAHLANPEEDMFFLSSEYGVHSNDIYYKGISAMMYMFIGADGRGIVSESDVPFEEGNREEITSSLEGMAMADSQGDIHRTDSDWIITGIRNIDVADSELIKQEILDKGAVQIAYEFSENNYNDGAYYTKYFGGRNTRTAVVVGWDDAYPRTNFREGMQPEKDGAWLLYDCIGSMLGSDGYIWLSYENKCTTDIISYDVAERSKYGSVLSYDKLGYNNIIKANGEEYTVIANVHETEEDETVSAIGIYSLAPEQQVEVEVYIGIYDEDPSSGMLAASMSVTADAFCYQVFELPQEVSVKAGEKFSVVLKYLNDDTDEMYGAAPTEGPGMSFSMGLQLNLFYASAEGQSFAKKDGTWYDLSREESADQFDNSVSVYNNACMKVLMKKK